MGAISRRVLLESIILFGIQVTGQDPYGNDVHGDVSLGTWPASVTPISFAESENSRDVFVHMYDFIVEPGCPVDGVDSVEWSGNRYEVVGDPKKYVVKTIPHHIEFSGRLIQGG